MTKKKNGKKVTINRGSPSSNMAIMGNIRQTTSPIIGETHEPIIVDLDQSKDKKEKKKTRKVTINRGSPSSNMAIMGNIRQTTTPIIGDTHEPVIIEVDDSKNKKDKKKKK